MLLIQRLKRHTLLLFLVLAVMMLLPSILQRPQEVYAAAPQCFVKIGVSPAEQRNCPNDTNFRTLPANQNKCFVTFSSEPNVLSTSYFRTVCEPFERIGLLPVCISAEGETIACQVAPSLIRYGACYMQIGSSSSITDCAIVQAKMEEYAKAQEAARRAAELEAEAERRRKRDELCQTGDIACYQGGAIDFAGSGGNPINIWLVRIIKFLSVGIGVLITISVIVSAIMWTASGGDPQARAKAVKWLWGAGTALLLFVFGWALINWLLPGGLA